MVNPMRLSRILLHCVLCSAVSTSARAQSPIAGEFRVNTFLDRFQVEPAVAYAADGRFLVTWTSYLPLLPGDQLARRGILARMYGAGDPSSSPFVVWQSDGSGEGGSQLTNVPGVGFLAAWREASGIFSRRYATDTTQLGLRVQIGGGEGTQEDLGGLCTLPQGGHAALSAVTQATSAQEIRLRALEVDGTATDIATTVDTGHLESAYLYASAVAASPTGELLAVWNHDGADGSGDTVFARAYDQNLVALGPATQLNAFNEGHQSATAGATAAIGASEFVVTWASEHQDGSGLGVFGQRLSIPDGKVGPEFRINTARSSTQWWPSVAADPHGNFIVIWLSLAGGRWEVRGQLYRRDASPVGQEFRLNDKPLEQAYSRPQVAFGPNGTFVAVWESWDYVGRHDWDISAQRFIASEADEACVVRAGVFLCDAGRTGGEPELAIRFANRPGDVPLAGDFDGDGRADFCAFQKGLLRCDLDHRGEVPDGFLDMRRQATAKDRPYFGDINGDHRADLCLRRGNLFRCNVTRRSNAVDVTMSFGMARDAAMLGDIDGDGRAEICVARDGLFRCDTAHDGGAGEVTISFGIAGDRPLLGDFDGDGRADPCVFRGNEFLCDTAHDGAAAEGILHVSAVTGDLPLLANLDGL
jgi:hypothetical protein